MDEENKEKGKVVVTEYRNFPGRKRIQEQARQDEIRARAEAEAQRQELIAQIRQYDKVMDYLVWVIAAIILNRYTIGIAREQLVRTLCPEQYEGCPPLKDTWCMRLFSNLLLLYSLSFFYCLAYQNNEANPSCSAQRASWGGLLVLVSTFLAFTNIITERMQGDTGNIEAIEDPEL